LVYDIRFRHNIEKGSRVLPLNDTNVKLTLSLVICISGLMIGSGCIGFFVMRGYLQEEPMSGSSYMAAIQGWMTFKWTMAAVVHLYRHHTVSNAKQLRIVEEP